MVTTDLVQALINKGECGRIEFKSDIPSKLHELTKEVCAFANADGGYILVGVDNDGRIVGVDINNSKRSAIHDSIGEISPALNCELSFVNIGAKSVYVLEVPNGKHKPYICSGSIWIRKGSNSQKLNSIEEIRGFFQECNKIFFDSMSCQEYGTDINTWGDAQTIDAFRTEARLSPQVPAKQFFENLHLFTEDKRAKNAAVLFFGLNPENIFPQAVVRCVLFKGTSKVYIIDSKIFGGSLYRQYTDTMSWLESKLQLSYHVDGEGVRKEIWEIPLVVFREALVNALAHRDYYERGATITIEVFDDRVEISNPGGLLLSVAQDFGRKSQSRNPIIFDLFMRMHLVEKIASGIPRMCDAMKEAGLPSPEFHTENIFTVILKRQECASSEGIPSQKNTHRVLLDIINGQPGVSAHRIALITGKDIIIIKSYLNFLIKRGLIEQRHTSEIDGYYIKASEEDT